MPSYVWSEPVMLHNAYEDDGYGYIIVDGGKRLRMSKRTFPNVSGVIAEATKLLDKEINVQTSQTTQSWKTSEWFSNVRLAPPVIKQSAETPFDVDEPIRAPLGWDSPSAWTQTLAGNIKFRIQHPDFDHVTIMKGEKGGFKYVLGNHQDVTKKFRSSYFATLELCKDMALKHIG